MKKVICFKDASDLESAINADNVLKVEAIGNGIAVLEVRSEVGESKTSCHRGGVMSHAAV